MPKVLEVLKRLLPQGSWRTGTWDSCPLWPPDVFAVSATLARMSACYSRVRISKQVRSLRAAGIQWRRTISVPIRAQKCWKLLVQEGDRNVDLCEDRDKRWWTAVLELTAIADEASRWIGFSSKRKSRSLFSDIVFAEHSRYFDDADRLLGNIPYSVCRDVPKQEVCVQPKTRTPQVGCTINALSHHLALLPPSTEVSTVWQLGVPKKRFEKSLNLLLVPFPYRIADDAFVASRAQSRKGKYFSVEPTWLRELDISGFIKFVRGLIARSKEHVKEVDGVVFPEGALTLDFAQAAAKALGRDGLEFLISGVSRTSPSGSSNLAYTALFNDGKIILETLQSKRHRWKLEKSQIERYQLSKSLAPINHSRGWWEDIQVGLSDDSSAVRFTVFRPGATMAVLICEDLARIEPIQQVIRSVGPNLVIVPLLDGAQRDFRWSARYAMALADDPGSAVLTLTALGMIHRERDAAPPIIGLWRDPEHPKTRELLLPWGCHGLLLHLETHDVRNWTLDSRSDLKNTVSLSLKRTWGV